MVASTPPRRDFRGLEQRRRKAARLFAAGRMILAAIARELRCSRQSVSRWYQAWKRGGAAGLRGAGRAGRKPKLAAKQLRVVEKALRQGARAHGFGTDLWTLPRVAAVIERLTGVRYHPGHVWKIRRAWIVFQDESGVSERPPVRRTWAPKGETPVLIHAFNWKKLSICAALGYRWDGKRSRLWFQTRPGSYDKPSLIAFLKDLKKHLRGAESHSGVGWTARAQKLRDATVPGEPEALASRGTLARLFAGSESGGESVGKHQGARVS
ncbi:MAG: helix-turn-helix domain-containing protein [Candidatus Solibacter sp.]|nr:helix-turn-helix domain-containing protein [Candidatus Solibacter sp.]